MRPFKKQGKHQARKSVAFDPLSNFVASQEGPCGQRAQSQTRTHNWTDNMDTIFMALLTEEHTLGNYVNGSFTTVAWVRINAAFNARTNLSLTKDQLKNRLKVLKRTFSLYNNLANKSGWGWDCIHNIPTPGDPTDWDAVIAENPSYARCRDRPFPPYKDLEFLTEKTTATGRYGFASSMPAAQTVESSSSSSPGEDDTNLGIRTSGFNISPNPFEAGSSAAPQYANPWASQTCDYPSSTPDIPNVGGTASGSGHSSGSKRPRSPPPTNPQPKPTASSGGRRRKPDANISVLSELVDLGKQKFELAREMYQYEKDCKSSIPTISICMSRVYAMPGMTTEKALCVGKALKDVNNRELFMTMNDEMTIAWVERQVSNQSSVYRAFFPGH